jgi:enamine deaminase RidA (YjgF/YER057c/UK114 family)
MNKSDEEYHYSNAVVIGDPVNMSGTRSVFPELNEDIKNTSQSVVRPVVLNASVNDDGQEHHYSNAVVVGDSVNMSGTRSVLPELNEGIKNISQPVVRPVVLNASVNDDDQEYHYSNAVVVGGTTKISDVWSVSRCTSRKRSYHKMSFQEESKNSTTCADSSPIKSINIEGEENTSESVEPAVLNGDDEEQPPIENYNEIPHYFDDEDTILYQNHEDEDVDCFDNTAPVDDDLLENMVALDLDDVFPILYLNHENDDIDNFNVQPQQHQNQLGNRPCWRS